MEEQPPIVVGVSGASGAPIAVRVLEALRDARVPVSLVVSDGARAVLAEEAGRSDRELDALVAHRYADSDFTAPIASGSRRTRGMVVVPCSDTTAAKIALGLADTLLTRAALVHLKERRPLVLVPRETPFPTTLLEHLASLSRQGVVILPPSPAYYLHPATVEDVTNFVAGKVLDHLAVPHELYRGWKAGAA